MTLEILETVNCETCGTGKSYWFLQRDGTYRCPVCDGNPLIEGSGIENWRERYHARFALHFGPRKPGDEALIEKYRESESFYYRPHKHEKPRKEVRS